MINKHQRIFFSGIFLLMNFASLQAGTVGSDSSSSRQLKTFFPAAHTNNKMTGFAVFENGLTLEDFTTTCSFDAFFPISGNITLNGGTLYLSRDLVLKSPLYMGVGRIDANEHAIEFPNNISDLSVPTQYHNKLIHLLDQINIGDNVNSVDWSFDDKYLAMVSDTVSGIHELQIYYFDGLTLTLTASWDYGSRNVYSVAWHPSDYYLATGQSGDIELKTFYFDAATGAFYQKDSADIGTTRAISWSPDGNYLAVGRSSGTSLSVYAVSNGVLGSSYSAYFDNSNENRKVQRNALDWDSTGSYIAVGLERDKDYVEVKIFKFTGVSLSLDTNLEIGANVYAVKWHPANPWLAIGRSSGSKRLELYEYDAAQSSMTRKIRAGENRAVYALDWSDDGTYLAMGRQAGSDHMEVRVFSFDLTREKLNLVTGYEIGSHIKAISWSHGGSYLASGSTNDKLNLYAFSLKPFIFDTARLFFNSDVTLRAPLRFEGVCILNAGDNIIELTSDAELVATGSAHVTIEHAIIKGITGNNIRCEGDTSCFLLRDVVWMQDGDFTFTKGSLQIKNGVSMMGDWVFAYQSDQTSTILSKSNLEFDVGFTFSYDPGSISKDLIEFEDDRSVLWLNGGTLHTTGTGIALKKGKLRIVRDAFLSAETPTINQITMDEGIAFGDGTAENDFSCEILSGVALHVNQGSLVYNNTQSSSLQMISERSLIKMSPNTKLKIYQDLDLGDGEVTFADNTALARASGKKIIGSVNALGSLAFLNI